MTDGVRNKKGQFIVGSSGNPAGRPKGSKNKLTLLKLTAEEAVRESNFDMMLEVANKIVQDALAGDISCRKMVWESMMSKGVQAGDTGGGAKPQISINLSGATELKTVNTIDGETDEGQHEADE